MNTTLRSTCKKFVPGNIPLATGEEFALIADWCKKNNFEADVYGSGDLISSFETKIAELLGFEASCFMPSGTMAQQIALKIYAEKTGCSSFAIHPTSHLELHEHRAYSHLLNLKSVIIGDKNRQLNEQDIKDSSVTVSTVIVELPAREIGGQLPTWKELKAISKTVKKQGAFLHMDGARLWETKAFYQKSYKQICQNFDSVYVSFYKGIGALTGAMLLGKNEFIKESRIWLRRFGGNLYQLHPYVASAAMRFDRAIESMPKYMQRTKEAFEVLKTIPGISFCPAPPQVNMFHLYLNAPAEKLTKARDEIAGKGKIWIANKFNPTPLLNLSYTEIYAGESLLQVSDDELFAAFSKLVNLSK